MSDLSSCDVAVIGSGPAGLSAALAALERGARVVLLEKMDLPGCKLLASGGGKCNLSNALEEEAFAARFGREGRFMLPALQFAYHDWLFDFLKRHGVPVRLTDGFHYFPNSERARDILDAFLSELRRGGAAVRTSSRVAELLADREGEKRLTGLRLADGTEIRVAAVVLASGGTAWPSLGGTRSGLALAEALGHQSAPLYPAMAPLLIREEWVKSLSGISLPDAGLSFRSGRNVFSRSGELLFTHAGLSGPCAIDLAGDLAEACARAGNGGSIPLSLSFEHTMDAGAWGEKLAGWRTSDGRRLVRTVLGWTFTHALADTLCRLAGCYDTKLCELSAPVRDALCRMLGAFPLTAYGSGPMEKAMAMKGGIRLREVSPETMESRIVPGLFFAGEVLDLVGPCGGYNIQWAFSSGRLAGFSAAGKIR